MPNFPFSDKACQKIFRDRVFREVRTELASPDMNELSTDHCNLINEGKES